MRKVWDDPLDVAFPDSIARPVTGLRVELRESKSTVAHSHRKAELFYAIAGQVTIVTASRIWIVPPSSALWVPGGVAHTTYSTGPIEVGMVFLELGPEHASPCDCRLVSVPPLLRELVLRTLQTGLDPVEQHRDEKLAAMLLDELATAPEQALELELPHDPRLRRLTREVLANPSQQITLADWASRIGTGERTLSRLFAQDLGINFRRWRQELHIRLAVRQLADKRPIGLIAFDLGYQSPSAFIAMFKHLVGVTPSRYSIDNGDARFSAPKIFGGM